MKKTIKVSGSKCGFKTVVSRKKRKGDVLAEGIDNRGVAAEASSACSWGFETGDTTESESINMKEECLVKETSMPKGLRIKTKKVLEKPLGVIDYGTVNTNDDMLDNFFLLLPLLPIKPTVQVPVRKFFVLDIDLVAIAGKSSQEKLSFIRKIFSSVNGFGGASTPSKFAGIICATFTSEKTMMTARKLANDYGVVVNTNLKCSINNCTNQAIVMKKILVRTSVEAVYTAVSEFGLIKSIKMQLVGLWQKAIVELEDQNQADLLASKWSILIGKDTVCVTKANVNKQIWDSRDKFRVLLYTLPVETNAYNLWDFVGLVGEKTCVINRNPVSYACACCATFCFGSESNLVSAMAATSVIKGIGLCWSHLSLALCLVCGLSGHTSLNCVSVKVGSTLRGRKTPLSAQDQIRLANIYAQKFMPISCPLAFSSKTWASVVGAPPVHSFYGAGLILSSNKVGKPLLSVASDLEKRLVNIESSFISLTEQIGELAKRLDSFVLAVLQPSSRCQLLVTPLSQNQEENIVMGVSLSDVTGDKTAAVLDSTASPEVVKLENMLEGLSALVMSLSVHLNGLALAGGTPSLSLPQ
ncbi:hypothetical protein G9A89_003464 [Geosiphon pyriformis]|nr:hypothetical protein G9A89_003464 [Geosiphon pyriformis]